MNIGHCQNYSLAIKTLDKIGKNFCKSTFKIDCTCTINFLVPPAQPLCINLKMTEIQVIHLTLGEPAQLRSVWRARYRKNV